MFFNTENLTTKIDHQERKIQTQEREMELLSQEIEKFLDELGITEKKLTCFVSDKKNFTEQNWTELQNHKKLLEELLVRDLKQIKDPRQTQKAMRSRNVSRDWIPLR